MERSEAKHARTQTFVHMHDEKRANHKCLKQYTTRIVRHKDMAAVLYCLGAFPKSFRG